MMRLTPPSIFQNNRASFEDEVAPAENEDFRGTKKMPIIFMEMGQMRQKYLKT